MSTAIVFDVAVDLATIELIGNHKFQGDPRRLFRCEKRTGWAWASGNMRLLMSVYNHSGYLHSQCENPRDFTRLTLKLFRKKFYQKPVSLVKLSFLKKGLWKSV
ncbi:hypothetical protein C4E24_07510 [ANME-1 cluster archaeon AG-394-G21]|nr:hypothetical protein [ANME-1 cluster archaeon AG-394-G21]